jgi:superfamily II DNA or RNA helicase
MFASKTWRATDARVLSHRGYAIRKDELTPAETRALQKALLMKPAVAPGFAAGVEPFPIYYESPSRWYVPRFWGLENCGVPDGDARQAGLPLRAGLSFAKTLRAEQLPIVEAFRTGVPGGDVASSGSLTTATARSPGFLDAFNGLVCVPCGYGKTFMGIWLACQLKRRFLIVVHQEFLMEQWKGELEASVPGIRVGKLQGPKAQLGPEFDCCICMLQTVTSREWPLDTFAGFGFTLFDECHHLGAEHFSRALMSIQTMNMLGLSATPDRMDGLDSVFQSYIGPVRYQIRVREADDSVSVRIIRFESADAAYADTPTDCRGEVSRPKLCNKLAEYAPRTKLICDELAAALAEGRKLLVLSDRRGHLEEFEREFRARGYTSMGYYVGGMKAAARDASSKCQIVLATFTLAAEGMNVRDLNTVALVTPKSRIEQAVGRIFRLKKEERTFAPIIYDVRDSHDVLLGQYRKRLAFYEQCGYQLTMKGPGDTDYKPIRVRRTRAPVVAVGGAGTAGGDDDEGVDYGDVAEEGVAAYKKEEPIPSVPMFRMAAPVKKV